MSVAKRPLLDHRNRKIIDNSDPGAFDKSYAGKPGTHVEYRCCENKPPYLYKQTSAFFIRKVADVKDQYEGKAGVPKRPGFNPAIGTELTIKDFASPSYEGNWTAYDPVMKVWRRWEPTSVIENKASKYDAARWEEADRWILPAGWVGVGMKVDPRLDEWWCKACETELEVLWSGLKDVGDYYLGSVQYIAMAVSYVPVLGTAVAFVLTTAAALAQGEAVDSAILDAVGRALPGQPASGMAFNAVRAIANGKRIDDVVLDTIPDNVIPRTVKDVIKSTVRIVERIADGQKITAIALDEIRKQLPPKAQHAMDVARRLANGEPLSDVAIAEIMDAANNLQNAGVAAVRKRANEARQAGEEAVNRFLYETGFQSALDSVPKELKDATIAALVGGKAERKKAQMVAAQQAMQNVQLFDGKETNVKRNDDLAAYGMQLMLAGATWSDANGVVHRVLDIRNGKPVTITDTWFVNSGIDLRAGAGKWVTEPRTFTINTPELRRTFDVGFGAYEGMESRNIEKSGLVASLAYGHDKGFVCAEAIQLQRTKERVNTRALQTVGAMIAAAVTRDERAALAAWAKQGLAMSKEDARIGSARDLRKTPGYRWGFDIGSGMCQGTTRITPEQTRVRTLLSPFMTNGGPAPEVPGTNDAMYGFTVAQAIQHGIQIAKLSDALTAAAGPAVASGALLAAGLHKAPMATRLNVLQLASNNQATLSGAAQVIAERPSVFRRIRTWLFGE